MSKKNTPKNVLAESRKGRPKKNESELHNNRYQVNFTEDEMGVVEFKAQQTGKRIVHYIHDASLSATVRSHINDEQVDLIRKLAGMGNNINQIAHRANQGGLTAIVTVCEQTVGRIGLLIQRIVRGGDLSAAE